MGRVVTERRTIGSVTKTISYTYKLNGSLASITYPSGRVLSFSYGNDARPVSAVDSANSINYAKSATYAPQGALASVVYGKVSGGFAGITASNSYNNRLLPTVRSASSSNGTALSLSYSYFANGNVNVETNGRDNGRSVTYTYDALNRVSTATSQATSGSDCWGQSFGYDRYANLTTINVTQCTATALSLSINTNNQITSTGFTYDAAGDLTGDGVNTYSWNGEALLSSAAGVTYTYDGELRRVKKSNGTLYWYCASCGKVLAESDLSGNITSEYTYFGNQRIARRDVSSGNVYYIFSDRLGSYRTLTDSSGNVQGESDYYPFGGERVISSTVTDSFRFASMEWDAEDGLNQTEYRKYAPALGRWETPDPLLSRPEVAQGLNRYSYVRDNPTNYADPTGLCGCWGGSAVFGEGDWCFPPMLGFYVITFDCGENKGSCCAYYTWLQNNPNSDSADRSYGKVAYTVCQDALTSCGFNCTRQCLVLRDIQNCLGIRSPVAREACRAAIHAQCFGECGFWSLVPNPIVVPFFSFLPVPVVIPIDVPVDYSCNPAWWVGWRGRGGRPRPIGPPRPRPL